MQRAAVEGTSAHVGTDDPQRYADSRVTAAGAAPGGRITRHGGHVADGGGSGSDDRVQAHCPAARLPAGGISGPCDAVCRLIWSVPAGSTMSRVEKGYEIHSDLLNAACPVRCTAQGQLLRGITPYVVSSPCVNWQRLPRAGSPGKGI